MSTARIDLKQLLFMINDNKDIKANYCLDEGCALETEDAKPLVKVINYLLNYLSQVTELPIEVSLDLRGSDCLMSFLAYTDKSDLPAISDQIPDALKAYQASFERIEDVGKHIQFKLLFPR